MGRRLLSLLILPLAMQAAGDAPLDRATLRGITAVNVVVDRLDPALAHEGLTAATLQDRIAQQLDKAHIRIDQNAKEFLGVRLTHVRDKRGPYALCVTLGLYQPVTLARDPKVRTATQTWEVESVVMAEPKLLNQASTETLDDLAARFVAAYREVNPATASRSGDGR